MNSINNENLRESERKWIEAIVSKKFLYREDIINQINCAEVYRNYTEYYISLKFKVDTNWVNQIHTNIRVPVEMRVLKLGKIPVQFLLHIVQGYIHELEIFNADSSKIDEKIILENAEIEIIINPELKCCMSLL